MKQLKFILGFLLLASCSQPVETVSKRQQQVDEKLKQEFSEIEMKTVKSQEYEISDKDYLQEKFRYLMNQADYYQNQYMNSNAQVLRDKFSSHAQAYMDEGKEVTDLMATYKGNRMFHKVATVRMNPDTSHYALLYFDDKDSLVYYIHHK